MITLVGGLLWTDGSWMSTNQFIWLGLPWQHEVVS